MRERCPKCGSKKYNVDNNETDIGNFKEVLCDKCGYHDTILILFKKVQVNNVNSRADQKRFSSSN